MALVLNNAILHTINNTGAASYFSNSELDVDSETCYEFVSKHVRRLLNTPGAKEATFSAESPVYHWVKSYQKGDLFFKDLSRQLCERLAAIIADNEDIPSADVLVAAFDNGSNSYLAILKLNYGECFTRRIIESENGLENQIVKNTAVLPLSSSKVEEACLIPYDPMVLRILEKPHKIASEEVYYFSQLFLECTTEMSKREMADIIHEIAGEINTRYFDDNVEMAATIHCALLEEAETIGEEDGLCLDNVASRIFPEKEEVKAEFTAMVKDAGLPHEVKLDKSFVQREFKTQRFKAENGIEIKFPTELSRDPQVMQFITNSDGTVTITLKNLRKHIS